MKVSVQQNVEFRPEWGDNHLLPVPEQLVVLIRTPSVAERQRYCGMDLSATVTGSSHVPRIDIRVDHISLVSRHVEEVSNLTVDVIDVNGRGIETDIRTAAELVNAIGLHDLVREIGQYISEITAQVRGVDPRLVGPSAPGSAGTAGSVKTPPDDA